MATARLHQHQSSQRRKSAVEGGADERSRGKRPINWSDSTPTQKPPSRSRLAPTTTPTAPSPLPTFPTTAYIPSTSVVGRSRTGGSGSETHAQHSHSQPILHQDQLTFHSRFLFCFILIVYDFCVYDQKKRFVKFKNFPALKCHTKYPLPYNSPPPPPPIRSSKMHTRQ